MVEPRKPDEIEQAAKQGLADVLAEYDCLISERFSKDPSVLKSQAERDEDERKERRIQELGRRLLELSKEK